MKYDAFYLARIAGRDYLWGVRLYRATGLLTAKNGALLSNHHPKHFSEGWALACWNLGREKKESAK
jgi:hypothetical protein